MAVQPGLYRTWSETPKTGFLTTGLVSHRMFGVCSIMKLVVAISAMVVAILAVLMYQYGLGIFFGSGTTLTDSARYNIQTGLMNVKVIVALIKYFSANCFM